MSKKTKAMDLFRGWADARKHLIIRQKNDLITFDNADNVAEALALWEFIINSVTPKTSWELRREFLKLFSGRDDLCGIVAMIESLPTSVWRRILWRQNIDFSSFEMFLRRLRLEDVAAIRANYDELIWYGIQPRILTRWEKCRKRFRVEALLSENTGKEARYESKGSWTFNLLGLDFGFNAFKSESEDKRVEEKSLRKYLRFLSAKNHADDFVVNQEFGKYWWLYRTVRSNYVWRPSRQVELKTHICPGFWYTLIMQMYFWLLSPAICLLFESGLVEGLPMHIAAPIFFLGWLMTPLWLVIAAVKLLLNFVFPRNARRAVADFCHRHEKKADMAGKVVAGAFGLAVVGFLFFIAGAEIFELLWPAFGTPISLWLTVSLSVYVGYMLFCPEKISEVSFFDQPLVLRINHGLAAIFSVVYGAVFYRSEIVESLLVLWGLSKPVVVFGVILLVAIVIYYFLDRTFMTAEYHIEDKKWYRQFFRGCIVLLAAMALAALGFTVYYASQTGFSAREFLVFTLATMAYALAFFLTWRWLKPEILEYSGKSYLVHDRKILYYAARKNPFLRSLKDDDSRLDFIVHMHWTITDIFRELILAERTWLYPRLIRMMDQTLLEKLNDQYSRIDIDNASILRSFNEYEISRVIGLVKSGESLVGACALLCEEKATAKKQKERRNEIILRVLNAVTHPIDRAVDKTISFIMWTWDQILTLFALYKYFNRLCPFVAKGRLLTFED